MRIGLELYLLRTDRESRSAIIMMCVHEQEKVEIPLFTQKNVVEAYCDASLLEIRLSSLELNSICATS